MGCIYKEILDNPDNYDQFKIQSTGVSQPEKSDVTQCLKGCRAMYPNAYFVGVLHKPNELECLCLQAGAFNASMLGPNVQCNQVCIILVKSSHFSFLAKKRGKLQIPREECEEIAKEKN